MKNCKFIVAIVALFCVSQVGAYNPEAKFKDYDKAQGYYTDELYQMLRTSALKEPFEKFYLNEKKTRRFYVPEAILSSVQLPLPENQMDLNAASLIIVNEALGELKHNYPNDTIASFLEKGAPFSRHFTAKSW